MLKVDLAAARYIGVVLGNERRHVEACEIFGRIRRLIPVHPHGPHPLKELLHEFARNGTRWLKWWIRSFVPTLWLECVVRLHRAIIFGAAVVCWPGDPSY